MKCKQNGVYFGLLLFVIAIDDMKICFSWFSLSGRVQRVRPGGWWELPVKSIEFPRHVSCDLEAANVCLVQDLQSAQDMSLMISRRWTGVVRVKYIKKCPRFCFCGSLFQRIHKHSWGAFPM